MLVQVLRVIVIYYNIIGKVTSILASNLSSPSSKNEDPVVKVEGKVALPF